MARRRNNGASKYVVRKAVASNLRKVGLDWRLSEVEPDGDVRQVGWFHDREDADFAAKCLNTFDARRSNPKRRKNTDRYPKRWPIPAVAGPSQKVREGYAVISDQNFRIMIDGPVDKQYAVKIWDLKKDDIAFDGDWVHSSYQAARNFALRWLKLPPSKRPMWDNPKRRKNIMSSAAGSYDDYGSYRSQRSSKRDRNPYSKRYTLASFSKKYWGEWYDDVDRTIRLAFWDDFKYGYTGGLGRYKEETRG
ncbi:MAG: hypothetical protein KAJ42_14590 [Gemmatimonadetes bacterium]|nr:hypothetical protein [Gemmatimonadota bacterium]